MSDKLSEIIECYEREYGLTNYMHPASDRLRMLIEHIQERGGSEKKRALKADLRNMEAEKRRLEREVYQLKRQMAGVDAPNLADAIKDIEGVSAKWRNRITALAMNVKVDDKPTETTTTALASVESDVTS